MAEVTTLLFCWTSGLAGELATLQSADPCEFLIQRVWGGAQDLRVCPTPLAPNADAPRVPVCRKHWASLGM